MVYLIAPNTPDERIAEIDALASGFVYAVSITGLTGSGLADRLDAVAAYLQRAKRLVQRNPVLVGFGIKTHADAARLSRHTDGFIVGSALIQQVERLWDDAARSPAERLAQIRRFALQTGDTVRDRFGGGNVRLPDEEAGTVMVFKTYDRISYGLVMEATQAIHIHDSVRNPS